MHISKSLSMKSGLIQLYIGIVLCWHKQQVKTSPTISAWELQCLLADKVKRMLNNSLMWGNIDEFTLKFIFTLSEFFVFL